MDWRSESENVTKKNELTRIDGTINVIIKDDGNARIVKMPSKLLAIVVASAPVVLICNFTTRTQKRNSAIVFGVGAKSAAMQNLRSVCSTAPIITRSGTTSITD